MSSGTFSSRADALNYRAKFTSRWSQFIRDNFDSAEHVAFVFRVDNKTARNWWEGSHAPSGFAVAFAFEAIPNALEALTRRTA